MRMILGLLPPQSNPFIEVAREAFSNSADGYLLKEGKSLPHVTLCAFQCANEKLREVIEKVKTWEIQECPVHFLGVLMKKGDIPKHHYSVSLSVKRATDILSLHRQIVDYFESEGIPILTPNRDFYLPHLTLAGIQWDPQKSVTLPPSINELARMKFSPFRFALGRGDDIGQFLEEIPLDSSFSFL